MSEPVDIPSLRTRLLDNRFYMGHDELTALLFPVQLLHERGHHCHIYTITSGEGTSYCAMCQAMARFEFSEDPEGEEQ